MKKIINFFKDYGLVLSLLATLGVLIYLCNIL